MIKTKFYKRILFLLVLLAMVFLFKPTASIAFSGSGSGTEADPYVITDVYELQEMDSSVLLDKHFVLGNDIDATETITWNYGKGFDAIGYGSGGWFAGTFDGQGHTITGLYINRPRGEVSLFAATIWDAEIKNVGLINVDMTGHIGVGAFVGGNYGDITKCYATGDIFGDENDIGGLVASNDGIITNCYFRGTVEGEGNDTGGLLSTKGAGAIPGAIINCYSTASVMTIGAEDPEDQEGSALVARNSGIITNSFWNPTDAAPATRSAGGGTQSTQAAMKIKDTYTDAGWDFVNIWAIDETGVINDGYPFFGAAVYVDIGLRIYDADAAEPIPIAVWPLGGEANSPLRIAKDTDEDGTPEIYGIALVDPGDPNDSGVRIKTSSGDIKALRKL